MKNGDCSENIHYLIEFVAYVTGGEKGLSMVAILPPRLFFA